MEKLIREEVPGTRFDGDIAVEKLLGLPVLELPIVQSHDPIAFGLHSSWQ